MFSAMSIILVDFFFFPFIFFVFGEKKTRLLLRRIFWNQKNQKKRQLYVSSSGHSADRHYKTDSMLSHISWSSRLYMNFVLLTGFWVISLPKLSRVTLEAKSSVGVR